MISRNLEFPDKAHVRISRSWKKHGITMNSSRFLAELERADALKLANLLRRPTAEEAATRVLRRLWDDDEQQRASALLERART